MEQVNITGSASESKRFSANFNLGGNENYSCSKQERFLVIQFEGRFIDNTLWFSSIFSQVCLKSLALFFIQKLWNFKWQRLFCNSSFRDSNEFNICAQNYKVGMTTALIRVLENGHSQYVTLASPQIRRNGFEIFQLGIFH